MMRRWFVLAWLLFVASCVGAPADEAPIASTATSIFTNNDNLASWDNAHWHVLGSGPIVITDNGSLPPCVAESFVATQQGSG